MNVARDPVELGARPRGVAIGTFDGVHLGHRRVLDAAQATGRTSTVVTFDPHPRIALGYEVELLTTLERRLELIAEAGIEEALVIEFDLELAKKESSENPVFYVQYAHARIASIFEVTGTEAGVINGHELWGLDQGRLVWRGRPPRCAQDGRDRLQSRRAGALHRSHAGARRPMAPQRSVLAAAAP